MTTTDLIVEITARLNAARQNADRFLGFDDEAVAFEDGRANAYGDVLSLLRESL